jgi:hypothetical protein
MKTGHDALGTADNSSVGAKRENETRCRRYRQKWVRERKTSKRDTRPSIPQKMSPEAQNMKTGSDAVCTAENGSGSAKH